MERKIEQHSSLRILVLHLLPGVLITAFYVAIAPLVRNLGFPSLMAVFLAVAVVLIPFELGYLIYCARRQSTSVRDLISYRERTPRAQFFALIAAAFIWSAICSVLLYPPLDALFIGSLFSWLPESFFFTEDFSQYSVAALLVTWAFGFVFNGIFGPVVEEIYFRGYLLPRLSRFGALAPLVNMTLFSVYHFFTPWQTLGRIIALIPMVYTVWWKRDIRIGIWVHVLGNVSSMLLLLPALLSK